MAEDGTQIGKSGRRYPVGDPRLDDPAEKPRKLVRREDLPEGLDPADVIDPTELSAAIAEAQAGALGYVNHGADAGAARPSGYAAIHWVGSVEPTNAVDGDVWTDTSA